MILDDLLRLLQEKTGHRPKKSGSSYSTRCPATGHLDKNPSVSVSEGKDGKLLLHCHAGCSLEEICDGLQIKPQELFNNPHLSPIQEDKHYTYYDEDGLPLYRKVRSANKKFRLERFENGTWRAKLDTVRRVLYNLPQVVQAIETQTPIFIVEGEKDADTLTKLGYVATTNDQGAGPNKWKKEHSEMLQDAHVLLFFDYDKAGIEHRDNIIRQLEGYVKTLKLVSLSGLEIMDKHGKDVTDWLNEGHHTKDLEEMVSTAEPIIENYQALSSMKKTLKASNIRAISLGELLTMHIEQPAVILHPFLTKSSLTMIYAARGLGKTFFSLGMALAISSGSGFLKYSAPRPFKVLYLDGEMSIYSMKDRLQKLCAGAGIKPLNDNFRLINPGLQSKPLPDIASSLAHKELEAHVQEADVIIIDNLSSWIKSGVENEGESWMPLQEWSLFLKHKGKAIVFVHHANKHDGQRGTSRREDALDYVIKLAKPQNYKPTNGSCFNLFFEKSRSLYGSDIEPLEVKLVNKPEGDISWEWSSSKDEDTKQMAIILSLHQEGKTYREISEIVGLSPATISRRLNN